MRHPATPFFSALFPLLFGRPPCRELENLQARALGSDSISELRKVLGKFVPDALLGRHTQRGRDRLFTPLVTFWAFLSQVLSPQSACRDAVRKAQAWWSLGRRRPVSTSTSAYCQARRRLSEQTLLAIHRQTAQRLEFNVPTESLWLGRRVKVVDGTTCSMPDTAESQKAYPQPGSQKPGCGFPMLKLVGLFCLASGALLEVVRGTLRVHESQFFRHLWPHLHPSDVLLADRGFCSFFSLSSLQERGVDCLMRLHQRRSVDFRRGKRLGPEDIVLNWTKPAQRPETLSAQEFSALPDSLTVRQIRLHPNIKGFRVRTIVLVTTLLDPIAFPAQALGELYFQRWSVELHFREIKTLLRLDILRCLSPQMVHKELLLHMIAYNLLRCLMQQAAICHHVDLSRISFKGTLDTLHHFADVIRAAAAKPRQRAKLYSQMLRLIALDQLPIRPLRSELRAKKRRPKNYQLLTKPRKLMIIIQHRSRHKAALT
jgi:Transposase DDE domain